MDISVLRGGLENVDKITLHKGRNLLLLIFRLKYKTTKAKMLSWKKKEFMSERRNLEMIKA